VGLVYLSWKDGKGYMIHLCRDPVEGVYGLKRFPNGEFWTHVSDDIKPDPIKKHGTMVVLLGRDELQDTMSAPPKAQMPRKWVLRYLNQRFYRLPQGVSLKAREGWDLPRGDKHNFLRTVTGMEEWLSRYSQDKGSVRLPNAKATAHWWITKIDADTNSGHYPPGGHMAALYQDELYELMHGVAGYARLQAFGVVFGCERVVIYVEPDSGEQQEVTPTTARTHLLIDGEAFSWAHFATEFREHMPDELAAFQDEVGRSAGHTDHRAAIRERLKSIRELFKFGRYRPSTSGKYTAGDPSENSGGNSSKSPTARREGSSDGGTAGGTRGDIYSLFAEEGGSPADFVPIPVEPEVTWISASKGTRSPGDLDDRAARYFPESNMLLINADFRAFTDMISRWQRRYDHVPGAENAIEQTVQEWFEQQLIETIMSALALRQGGRWSAQELPELWSETALTAAVLPRYHIDLSVKRMLGQRLGRLPVAA
jgi:hypothetical protein